MHPASFARLRHYFNRLKPEVPVPVDDPERWYVDFDEQGLRGERCITTAASTINLAEEPTCQIFTGFAGSGKTSELLRLVRNLERDEHFVVYADALESIDTQNELAYSDVLIALGLAAGKALDAAQKKGAAAQWWRRFTNELWGLLSSEIKLPGFKGKVGDVEIGVELRANPSFRLELRAAANARRLQLLEQVQRFFGEADRFVRASGYPGGIVLILDNLEKLSGSDEVQASARKTFVHQSDALRAPGVHTIYTLPARMVFSRIGPELGKLYDGEPLVLPTVRVTRRNNGAPFEPGRRAMTDLLLRRLDFTEVFGGRLEPVVMLVNASGGYARDLLRMAQYAIQLGQALPLTEAHVGEAILKLRRSYVRGYSTAYDDLLAYIHEKRPAILPAELMGSLEEAMDGHFVMVYGNDENWYDVHPLVAHLLDEEALAGPPPRAAPPLLTPRGETAALPDGAEVAHART